MTSSAEPKIWDQDQLCPWCDEPYSRACPIVHVHDAYCVDIDDVRRGEGACDHYGHKNCVKGGTMCPTCWDRLGEYELVDA